VSDHEPADARSGGEKKHLAADELGIDLSRLPANDAEAATRSASWSGRDPFPEIEPALLNTADLFDYIAVTGMIHPLRVDGLRVDETLKPASCGIRIGGPCAYWKYDGPPDNRDLKYTQLEVGENDVLTLPPNSIVYATLAPRFRLPDYMAARFNLSIGYVYRGLLVGTGPLVDPGFDGTLQIPLHNLTSTPCEIPTADAVLWMEFTKLSPNDRWTHDPSPQPQRGVYVPFPERKRQKTLKDYLDHANQGEPIVSSIPTAVEDASNEAQKASAAAAKAAEGADTAAEEAKDARQNIRLIRWASFFAALVGGVTLLAFVFDIGHSIRGDADTALHRSNELEEELLKLRTRIRHVEAADSTPTPPSK
jgi:deoxycytidine triphosphate deaminase